MALSSPIETVSFFTVGTTTSVTSEVLEQVQVLPANILCVTRQSPGITDRLLKCFKSPDLINTYQKAQLQPSG